MESQISGWNGGGLMWRVAGLAPLMAMGLFAWAAEGATLIGSIDDFEEGAQDLRTDEVETLTSTYTSSNPGTAIMGGVREVEFAVTSNPAGRNARMRVQTGSGRLFTQLRGGTAAGVTVRYNRGGTGLGGIDLRNGGGNGFGFAFETSDADLEITVSMTDTSGRTATATLLQAAADPVDPVTVLFNEFNNPGGADFSSADSIEVTFNPAVAGDFRLLGLGMYDIVPEPSSAGLVVVGLIAFAGRRRRSRD